MISNVKSVSKNSDTKSSESVSLPFSYNPEHACGTCAKCGGEMIYNIPRLGKDGGFIHKETGRFICKSLPQ